MWVVYHSQQAENTSGTQMAMHCGNSYLPLHDTLQSPAEDIIDYIWEEPYGNADKWHPNLTSSLRTKTGFQMSNRKHPRKTIGHQWFLEVIQITVLELFANYKQSIIAHKDVASL